MRNWDLISPAVKIDDAMRKLNAVRTEVEAQWDDQTSQKFQEKYLVPLEAKVKRVLDAVKRFNEVTFKAQRACEDERGG